MLCPFVNLWSVVNGECNNVVNVIYLRWGEGGDGDGGIFGG